MNPPKHNGRPEYSTKMEARAFTHFKGLRDPESIKLLIEWLKREEWRGILRVTFVGNGGINDTIFEEVRRITEVSEGGNIEVSS